MMKRFSFGFVFGVLVVCLGASVAQAAVTLRSQTDVNRTAIRLADVFDGLPEGLDRDIATAPLPGQSVTYDMGVLNKLAQQYRLDWQAQTLNDHCILTRASTRISQDMIREALTTKIKAQKQELKDMQIELAFDNRSLEVLLPADQPALFVLNNFSYDTENHRFRADLIAGTPTRPVVLPVTGRVNVKRNVPVLARRMDAGEVISDADLTWETVMADRLPVDMLTAPGSLIGKELRRDTAEDVPLRTRDIMQPRLITHGTLVTMKIETPVLLVTAQGRAMQDGCLGDTIRVTNTQSKRVIEGTVVGPNTIRIGLPQANTPTVHAAAAGESRWQ